VNIQIYKGASFLSGKKACVVYLGFKSAVSVKLKSSTAGSGLALQRNFSALKRALCLELIVCSKSNLRKKPTEHGSKAIFIIY
jgi:hypothetical protein